MYLHCHIDFRFTEPPECHYPPGSSLTEITKYSLDTSYILDQMAKKHDWYLFHFDYDSCNLKC